MEKKDQEIENLKQQIEALHAEQEVIFFFFFFFFGSVKQHFFLPFSQRLALKHRTSKVPKESLRAWKGKLEKSISIIFFFFKKKKKILTLISSYSSLNDIENVRNQLNVIEGNVKDVLEEIQKRM